MFEYGGVARPPLLDSRAPAPVDLAALRERVRRMEGAATPDLNRRPIGTHPDLAGVVELRSGGVYEVGGDARHGLLLTLLSGPSRTGAWCAVVGVPDLGVVAASEAGINLERTILVPDPGEAWLEVTAALLDVAGVVAVRPPGRVAEGIAAKMAARLRKRGSTLISLGPWPRSEVRLSGDLSWTGLGRGWGHLAACHRVVTVRGAFGAPARPVSAGAGLRRIG